MEQNNPDLETAFSPYKLFQNVRDNSYDILKRDNEKVVAKFFYSFEDSDFYKEFSAFNAAGREFERLNDKRYESYSQAIDKIKWRLIHSLHDKFKDVSVEDLNGEIFGEMVRYLEKSLNPQNYLKEGF